jgi:UDP-N-acetylglucosamine 2-epimerase (non-hydrolysing)
MLKRSKLVITDSGGVQEEACILQVPCITTRENTERPETVIAKLNIVTGYVPYKIVDSALKVMDNVERGDFDKRSPYGDGYASRRIVNYLEKDIR